MDTGSQSVSTASISVTQLMRTINSITEQLQDILKKWYRQIIIDNGFPVEYTPNVEIIDSEQLEMSLKKDLATLNVKRKKKKVTKKYFRLDLLLIQNLVTAIIRVVVHKT